MLKRLGLCLGIAACADPEAGRREPPAPPAPLVLAAGGARLTGPPLVVQVAEGADPPVQISLAAAAGGESRTVLGGATLEALLSPRITLTLGRQPLRAGVGVHTHRRGEAAEVAPAGALTLALEGERASGRLEIDGAAATFTGRVELTCWVRPATLGRAPNGAGAGMAERVLDQRLQSPFCAPLRR